MMHGRADLTPVVPIYVTPCNLCGQAKTAPKNLALYQIDVEELAGVLDGITVGDSAAMLEIAAHLAFLAEIE
jgi:hypothetical protein